VFSAVNEALVRLKKRAEQGRSDPAFVRDTFVDVTNTMTILHNRNPQVVLGRRGSGKTHTLLALADRARSEGDLAVYVDLRELGSSGSVYDDPSLPLEQRGTRLFLDIAGAIHEELRRAVYAPDGSVELLRDPAIPAALDRFAETATQVKLAGPREQIERHVDRSGGRSEADVRLGLDGPEASYSRGREWSQQVERESHESGPERYYVHFSALRQAITAITDALSVHEVSLLVLLDEWNSLPVSLQPYVADLVRRGMLSVDGVAVKVAGIQHRARWAILTESGSYVGLEIGSDIFPDLDLDERQVGFNRELAKRFFRELITKHVLHSASEAQQLSLFGDHDPIDGVFATTQAFEELVEAAEGVPRDGIAILGIAAASAESERLTVPVIRDAARRHHEQSKLPILEASPEARRLMYFIVDHVISERRTRGFLVAQSEVPEDEDFQFLVDQRLLHRIRRGISSRDLAGERFDAFVVDYGFYVDRRTTRAAPLPLKLYDDHGNEVDLREVPTVDYRSVRGAVLSLREYRDLSEPQRTVGQLNLSDQNWRLDGWLGEPREV
jgi:hypothetical protein